MRVLALVSGGKDSCQAALECVLAGHELVAAGNLHPADDQVDELDSFMFQTVGHQVVAACYQDALGVPLLRVPLNGRSVSRDMQYQRTDGDEVEDLARLLAQAKHSHQIQGVCSGAILSDYQRLRVEHVCSRLGLTSLAPLWQREQRALLDAMIAAPMHAVLIKVAAMGLSPGKHLGKTLAEIRGDMHKLNQLYDLQVCGEGGEFESLTLDCPLFRRRIVLDSPSVLRDPNSNDDMAPVGYLKCSSWHLDEKPGFQAVCAGPGVVPAVPGAECCPVVRQPRSSPLSDDAAHPGQHAWLPCQMAPQASALYSSVARELDALIQQLDVALSDVYFVHLYLADMRYFPDVNAAYVAHFGLDNPPSRICVAVPLPEGQRIAMDVMTRTGPRRVLHVQSISKWAPACIGPYSQASLVGGIAYIAGQIPLDPWSMSCDPGAMSITDQAQVCMDHTRAVTRCILPRGAVALATVFLSARACQEAAVLAAFPALATVPLVTYVGVTALPRGVDVEVQAIACSESDGDDAERSQQSVAVQRDQVGDAKLVLSSLSSVFHTLSVSGLAGTDADVAVAPCISHMLSSVLPDDSMCVRKRVFYTRDAAAVAAVLETPGIQVEQLPPDQQLLVELVSHA